MKSLRIYYLFARSFFAANIAITLCSAWLAHKAGWIVFGPSFYFKVATSLLILYFANNSREKYNYYFFNLGYSKRKLQAVTVAVDMLSYLLIIILILCLR